MSSEYNVQVKTGHYSFENYVAKPRFCSYWHQVDEVLKLHPNRLLLIGAGDGIVPDILKKSCPGIQIVTFDYDSSLQPDVVGDIRNISSFFSSDSFDCILCSQVLEHIEYRFFSDILCQLSVIAPAAVVSVPCQCRTFGFSLDLPKLHIGKHIYPEKRRMSFSFDGQHYWEAGTKEHSVASVCADISVYYNINNRFHVPEKPWHLFFSLSRKEQ